MAETRTRRRRVSVPDCVEPVAVTLVKSPSNRSGFREIRSDGDKSKEKVTTRTRKTKQKRNDAGLLSIELPADTEQSEVEAIMDRFGLADDYTPAVRDDGTFVLLRNGVSEDFYEKEETFSFAISEDMVANVASSSFGNATRGDSGNNVSLVSLHFDETFGSVDDVKSYLAENEIDFNEGGVEKVDGGVIVTRHEEEAGKRKVKLGEGVTGYVVRSDEVDIPTRIYRNVMEQAYGNYGWGHIDFVAALADPEFSIRAGDAIWVLRDVLDEIVFFSRLGLDDRKRLIKNACDAFSDYMASLIDALPRSMLEQTRSDDSEKQETGKMTTKAKNQRSDKATDEKENTAAVKEAEKTAARSDEGKEGKEAAEKEADDKGSEYVTRSELEEMFQKYMGGSEAKKDDGESKTEKRSEKEGGETASDKETKEKEKTERSDDKEVSAFEEMTKTMASVCEQMKTLRSDIDKMGDSTVVHSDNEAEGEEEKTAKRSDKGMFTGAIFGKRG